MRDDELFEGVDITITAEAFADSVSHYNARSLPRIIIIIIIILRIFYPR